MWDYNGADFEQIRQEITSVHWDTSLQGKNVNQMVDDFTSIFKDIIGINIPYKNAVINDRDAPWVNHVIKMCIKKNHRVYRRWVKRGRPLDGVQNVKYVQKETNSIIRNAKKKTF